MIKQTTIKLLKPHRHAGRDYPAGGELTMADHRAQWLIGIGKAKPVDIAAAPASATTKQKD